MIHKIDTLPYNLHFIYAHGQLERRLNTDLLSGSMKELPQGVSQQETPHGPALAFIWNRPMGTTGLVVLNKDKRALKYAYKVYFERAQIL